MLARMPRHCARERSANPKGNSDFHFYPDRTSGDAREARIIEGAYTGEDS
jgi:hypothetical protein